MKRMIKFGSIDQFRQVVKSMQRFDRTPVVEVLLTEKIHGSNAGISYSRPDGLWAQSKNNIITPEKDNAGFAQFVETNRVVLIDMIECLAEDFPDIDLDQDIITLYCEWCGGNIQKNSCVSGLDKRIFFFPHFRVSGLEEEVDDMGNVINSEWKWLPSFYAEEGSNIFHVLQFPSWTLEIDFSRPAEAQNKLVELVEQIENESPIGTKFDKKNIGEGVVGTFFYGDRLYRFKAKGEKHSKSKVKKIKATDPVKEAQIVNFVNNHGCPAWRLEQMWQELFGIENEKKEPTVTATGDFIRLVHQDVLKEESDLLEELDLTWKEVVPMLSKSARVWFMEQLDQEAGLG